MARQRRTRAGRSATAIAVCLAALLPTATFAADLQPNTAASPGSGTDITNPANAPIITITVTGRRRMSAAIAAGNGTVISSATIANQANNSTLTGVIASKVPGAASASSGDLHIRGSHGQYSYFLDDAPLPTNVSGSFSDLINPKDIQTLRVYTGGFPAQYGGQLAAIFDITAKGGSTPTPRGFIQQLAGTYGTYQSIAQVGGQNGNFDYFASGIKNSTDFRLSPETQNAYHDDGLENIGFGKFDYQSGKNNRLSLDLGTTGAQFQVPNNQDSEEVGQNDVQKENTSFANAIWDHTAGPATLRVAFYSHESKLRYFGSPGDLVAPAGMSDTGLSEVGLNQTANYLGLRSDYSYQLGKKHILQTGFDFDNVTGQENFTIHFPEDSGSPDLFDIGKVDGGDRSAYVQDDLTIGRSLVDYGVRYDLHHADINTTQYSPRFNVTYTAGRRDKIHAYYDRLFQPAAIESVQKLGTESSVTGGTGLQPFEPERDDFYETGLDHKLGTTNVEISAYYRTEKDTIDDTPIGNTQVTIPVNFAKGYVRGIEFALDGPINRSLSYYANYARGWAYETFPIIGGIISEPNASGYFPDDHNQTHTVSSGLDYEHHGRFLTLDGDYGSGFPYQLADGTFEYTHPHLTFDTAIGTNVRSSTQLALLVTNALNHAYIIKQAGVLTDTEWSQGRTYGIRLTQNF